MLARERDFRHRTPSITVSGGAVYCAAVRRWPSRQARQSTCLRSSILRSGKGIANFRRVENFQGVGRSLTKRLWRAGGTPKTHLVPQFCRRHRVAVMTKHFLSRSPNERTSDDVTLRRQPYPASHQKQRAGITYGCGFRLCDTRSGDRAFGGAASNGTPQRFESAHGRFAQRGQRPPVGARGA